MQFWLTILTIVAVSGLIQWILCRRSIVLGFLLPMGLIFYSLIRALSRQYGVYISEEALYPRWIAEISALLPVVIGSLGGWAAFLSEVFYRKKRG